MYLSGIRFPDQVEDKFKPDSRLNISGMTTSFKNHSGMTGSFQEALLKDFSIFFRYRYCSPDIVLADIMVSLIIAGGLNG